ncbi:MAG: hypothetical protein ACLQBD_06330 [Syntrophobacteraceae bacterium]
MADFKVRSFRFSSTCGNERRIATDLGYDDFAAGALTFGRLTIHSSGTQMRILLQFTVAGSRSAEAK